MLRPTEQLISCEVSRPTMPVHFRRPRIVVGIMLLIGLFSTSAWSACTKITAQSQLAAGDGTASAWAGSLDYNNGSLGLPGLIDLSTNANFQPDGTLLAAATSDFTTFALNTGYDPERVLFRCAATDVDQLFEMYATNGDNDYGGKNEDGLIAGNVPSGFATVVANVVIRLTNLSTGEYYSRLWKGRRLTGLDTDSTGRILVKAKISVICIPNYFALIIPVQVLIMWPLMLTPIPNRMPILPLKGQVLVARLKGRTQYQTGPVGMALGLPLLGCTIM